MLLDLDIGDQKLYYVALPDAAHASDTAFWSAMAARFRDFRRRALQEPGPSAQGGWTLEQDSQRSDDSYLRELTDPDTIHYALVRTTNKTRPGPGAKPSDANALLDCQWVGMGLHYGPLRSRDWTAPSLRCDKTYGGPEALFTSGGFYIFTEFRAARDSSGRDLAPTMLSAGIVDLEARVRRSAPRLPVYLRMRYTMRPETGHLRAFYKRFLGGVLVGYVPEAAYMVINNKVLPENAWPAVHVDPGFYANCKFAVYERVAELHEDGTSVLLSQPLQHNL